MKTALLVSTAALAALLSPANAANTGVKITEWMYNTTSGTVGEFVELTNFGPTTVDFTGWSFDDSTRLPGSLSLSNFGLVAPGVSVLITDATAAEFRAAWSLSASVKIIGGNIENLSRSDEMNVYDSTNTLVDELTYNDQGTGAVAGPRTNGAGGRVPNTGVLGANTASQWVLETVGDPEGSYTSGTSGNIVATSIGSPGKTSFPSIPEPGSAALLSVGIAGLFGFRRRAAR